MYRKSGPRDQQYFPVVRHGIQDQPRTMRFGKCTWSKHDDTVKHNLVLVERAVDETLDKPTFPIFQPEINNAIHTLAAAGSFANALLEELVSSGALTTEAAERVRNRPQEETWRCARALFQEVDIDGP